jgi:hypothetical protein
MEGLNLGLHHKFSILLAIFKLYNYIKQNMKAKLRLFQGDSTKNKVENTELSKV